MAIKFKAHICPETGKTYYVNESTGKSQWKDPRKKQVVTFTSHFCPQTGKTFYLNQTTGETQWTDPRLPSTQQQWQSQVSPLTLQSVQSHVNTHSNGQQQQQRHQIQRNHSTSHLNTHSSAQIQRPVTRVPSQNQMAPDQEAKLSLFAIAKAKQLSKRISDKTTQYIDPVTKKKYYVINFETRETRWCDPRDLSKPPTALPIAPTVVFDRNYAHAAASNTNISMEELQAISRKSSLSSMSQTSSQSEISNPNAANATNSNRNSNEDNLHKDNPKEEKVLVKNFYRFKDLDSLLYYYINKETLESSWINPRDNPVPGFKIMIDASSIIPPNGSEKFLMKPVEPPPKPPPPPPSHEEYQSIPPPPPPQEEYQSIPPPPPPQEEYQPIPLPPPPQEEYQSIPPPPPPQEEYQPIPPPPPPQEEYQPIPLPLPPPPQEEYQPIALPPPPPQEAAPSHQEVYQPPPPSFQEQYVSPPKPPQSSPHQDNQPLLFSPQQASEIPLPLSPTTETGRETGIGGGSASASGSRDGCETLNNDDDRGREQDKYIGGIFDDSCPPGGSDFYTEMKGVDEATSRTTITSRAAALGCRDRHTVDEDPYASAPTRLPLPGKSKAPPAKQPSFTRYLDVESAKYYYVSQEGVSQWIEPSEWTDSKPVMPGRGVRINSRNGTTATKEKVIFRRFLDKDTMKYYYVNQSTGKSQWKDPLEQIDSSSRGVSKGGNPNLRAYQFPTVNQVKGSIDANALPPLLQQKHFKISGLTTTTVNGVHLSHSQVDTLLLRDKNLKLREYTNYWYDFRSSFFGKIEGSIKLQLDLSYGFENIPKFPGIERENFIMHYQRSGIIINGWEATKQDLNILTLEKVEKGEYYLNRTGEFYPVLSGGIQGEYMFNVIVRMEGQRKMTLRSRGEMLAKGMTFLVGEEEGAAVSAANAFAHGTAGEKMQTLSDILTNPKFMNGAKVLANVCGFQQD